MRKHSQLGFSSEVESSDIEGGGGDGYQDVNQGWPSEAHYVPVLPNAHNLSIREQPQPMRRMIRAAVSHVSGNSLFDSAYPAAEKVEFESFHRDIFIRCAKRLKYPAIVKRIECDDELVKLCARVVRVHSISDFNVV